jgi:hypothetical protein
MSDEPKILDGIAMPPIHPSITMDLVLEAMDRSPSETDALGFCLACGESVREIATSTRRETCGFCGCPAVFGAEEIMFILA